MLYKLLVIVLCATLATVQLTHNFASKSIDAEEKIIYEITRDYRSGKIEDLDLHRFDESEQEYIHSSDYVPNGSIVEVAISQLGNAGGEKFWSWYGFNSHAAWCACFVSWCANQCGYIDAGIVPKFALCQNGVDWFKQRGQWLNSDATPEPGMLIFFDYGQNGEANHVGIVEKVEGNSLYVIDGNSKDQVRENVYSLGEYDIMGYATPKYN